MGKKEDEDYARKQRILNLAIQKAAKDREAQNKLLDAKNTIKKKHGK